MRHSLARLVIRTVLLLLALTAQEADAAEYSGPLWGGSGGTKSYNLDCGSSGVMVGVYGKHGSWIDQIGVTCRSVAADGSLGSTYTRGPVGGTGGTVARAQCPAGHVVGGMASQSGSYIDHVRLRCDKWNKYAKRRDQVVPFNDIRFGGSGSPTQGAFGIVSKQNPIVTCPRDKVGKAIRGKRGGYIDSMRFVCDAYNR